MDSDTIILFIAGILTGLVLLWCFNGTEKMINIFGTFTIIWIVYVIQLVVWAIFFLLQEFTTKDEALTHLIPFYWIWHSWNILPWASAL